jgi:hypothetical protein
MALVEHGRRADATVKNMLLHSREGSGELREVELNAVAEESLTWPTMARGPKIRAST